MGWEDTWIPRIWTSIEDSGHQPDLSPQLLEAKRLTQETENHRILRLGYSYKVLPDSPAVREVLLGELGGQRRAFMGSEIASPTYTAFWAQGIGAVTLAAADRDDREVLRHCQRWWENLRALYAWMSVPKGAGGTLRPGDVVPVACRANRDRNRDEGTMLRLLCRETDGRDRRVIDRSAGMINLQQLELARRIVDRKIIPVRPLDPEALRDHLPSVQEPIHIERWREGYRAWIPKWRGIGPAQLSVTVHRGEVVEIQRGPKTRVRREWPLEKDPPEPLGEIVCRVSLGPSELVAGGPGRGAPRRPTRPGET